jgi:hypothetical protein
LSPLKKALKIDIFRAFALFKNEAIKLEEELGRRKVKDGTLPKCINHVKAGLKSCCISKKATARK